jgi:hypothetical protein
MRWYLSAMFRSFLYLIRNDHAAQGREQEFLRGRAQPTTVLIRGEPALSAQPLRRHACIR